MLIICIICGKDIVTNYNQQKCCSKECRKIQQKEYYQNNKIEIKDRRKKYQIDNKEKIKKRNNKRRQTNKYITYNKKYRQTLKGKESLKRTQNKRRRNLGFNPLNNYFNNSEGHHINKNDIIYIPFNYHFKGHSITKNRNMESINTIAFFFLMMQNINEFQKY